jgi:hypothetical protein
MFEFETTDSSMPQQFGRSPGQAIINDTDARVPSAASTRLVPIVARIVWADDGEEHVETVALGWTGRNVYVWMEDRRYSFTPCLFDAADVRDANTCLDAARGARGPRGLRAVVEDCRRRADPRFR